jgi:CIC family chloride channel protein
MSDRPSTRIDAGLLTRVQLALLRLTSLSIGRPENRLLFVAIVCGVFAGLGSAAFIYALSSVGRLFFGTVQGALGWMGPSSVILLPALGGLLVGPFIARFAPEARGHGVPEVMTAVATRGGRIQGRVAIVKILASAMTIGSGGSAGQEGPMVQIGAAAASAIGQRLRVTTAHMRTIVACGAAGGLAAVFNAPIGGAMFALEVITGELTPAFGAVILSSVTATAVSRSLFGNYPSFVVPRYELVSNYELLLYAVFGVLAGLVSTAFIRTLYKFEAWFGEWQFPATLKPFVGGLMVGLLARFAPQILGTGVDAIEDATWNRMGLILPLLLVPLKIVATSVTLGSGGSGGVFGPSMYVGAMLGAAFGAVVHTLLPGTTAGPGAYALVGIGALVGGTALAPLTAIILLFEMTDDYRIILPAMEATVFSIVVSRALVGESIYTLKLRQENIRYYPALELARAHALTVLQAVRPGVEPVRASEEAFAALATAGRLRAPALSVIGDDGTLRGIVTVDRLASAVAERPTRAVGDLLTYGPEATILQSTRLDAALARFAESDFDALVVLSDPPASRMIGVVTRTDVLRLYEKVLRNS